MNMVRVNVFKLSAKLNNNEIGQIQQFNCAMKNTEIKRILVPTDFSETGMLALEHAAYMASLLKAHLYLLHVVEAVGYTYSAYESEAVMEDIEDIYATAELKLQDLAQKLNKSHLIDISTIIGAGRPASSIAATVKDNNIDLIIMGTHGATGFEEYFIGSNAHKVVSVAPCPVITIQGHAGKPGFKNIVMPIDNSLYSSQKANYVHFLASSYGSQVHILGLLNSNDDIDEKKFNTKLNSVEKSMERAGISFICKTVKGENIATEAMKYSDEVNADLIVIMTDHESTLKKYFLGGLAKQIVNHSTVPVMSIRPVEEGHWEASSEGTSKPLS